MLGGPKPQIPPLPLASIEGVMPAATSSAASSGLGDGGVSALSRLLHNGAGNLVFSSNLGGLHVAVPPTPPRGMSGVTGGGPTNHDKPLAQVATPVRARRDNNGEGDEIDGDL